MRDRFAGKVVLVTGAGSGIGEAAARRFGAEGARLALGDVDEARLSKVTREVDAAGEGAFGQRTDVRVLSEVEALTCAAVERFGRLDVVFNNAGAGVLGRTPDIEVEAWLRAFDVNVHAVFYGCRAAIPHLRAAGGGTIVNTASISGLGGDSGLSAYNAAKGAVVNYTRAAAIDHARENIRINAVCPGPVDTPGARPLLAHPALGPALSERIPMGRPGRAEEIAAAVAFLASDDASFITGALLTVDGGLTAGTGQPDLDRLLRKA